MNNINTSGFSTLQAIGKADSFNQWMFSAILPFCTGKILEIGSGIGNISFYLVRQGYNITLSDINSNYLELLKKKFNGFPNVKGILSINLQDTNFETTYKSLVNTFDCIVMLNVLEHLENESSALHHCSFMLKPGGTLITLVPSYKWLYSRMDKELGHYKRYTANKLNNALTIIGFDVTKIFYFNALGIIAWLYGKITRTKKISSGEMKVFNQLTGLGKLIDKVTTHKIGLSVVGIAQKKI